LDYATAETRFEQALALYRKSEHQHSIAVTLVKRGLTQRYASATGHVDIETGFALYFATADSQDLGLPGWHALHHALSCNDALKADAYRDEARAAWTSIGRLDLVHEWLDLML
jgi:hypothetical protein